MAVHKLHVLRSNVNHQRQFVLKGGPFRLYDQTVLGYEFPLLCFLEAIPGRVH